MERTSTPAVGLISTSSRGSLASARAMTTFCWLPPDRPETGSSGPGRLDRQVLDHAARRAGPGGGALMNPCGPSRSGTVRVALSAIDMSGTKPWWCRSCGTNPTPAASAAGTLPGRGRRPAISTVPARGRAQPDDRLGDLGTCRCRRRRRARRSRRRRPGTMTSSYASPRRSRRRSARPSRRRAAVPPVPRPVRPRGLAGHRGDQFGAWAARRPARSGCAGRRGTPSPCRRSRRSPAGGG